MVDPAAVQPVAPLLIDGQAGRIYARARAGAEGDASKTVVFSARDGRRLAIYGIGGPLGLDPAHGWLYVDRGAQGLAVVEAASGRLLRTIALPVTPVDAGSLPAPQADPTTGEVLAARGPSVYVADGSSGGVVRRIDFDLRPQDNCQMPHDAALPVEGLRLDSDRGLLYVDFVTYACIPWIGYTTVSYDLAAGKEIARGSSSGFRATVAAGRQYAMDWYRMGNGTLSAWRDGKPAAHADGWSGGPAQPQYDARRGRVYQAAGGALRVFDAGSLKLLMALPLPAPGDLAGYDPVTDQLYFRSDSGLQPVAVAALASPAPQPPQPATPPVTALKLLAPVPGSNRAVFGVWDAGTEIPGECYVFNQNGGRLFVTLDGGGTWRRPTAGLPGGCALVIALAVSPDYARDQTVFAALAGSGLFKTTDGGALWQPASAGLPNMGIRQILVSPGYATDHTLFVVDINSTFSASQDGGQSWHVVGDMAAQQAALSPEFAQDGTIAVFGYGPGQNLGLLRLSHDRGAHWEEVNSTNAPAAVAGLSLAPAFARWQTLFGVGMDGKLYRSADAGKTWQAVLNTGLTTAWSAQIVYGPGETNRPVFLLASGQDASANPPPTTTRLFRSRDGGQTWQAVQAMGAASTGETPTSMALSPTFDQDGLLLLGTSGGKLLAVKGLELPEAR